jgi:hypothetical protein
MKSTKYLIIAQLTLHHKIFFVYSQRLDINFKAYNTYANDSNPKVIETIHLETWDLVLSFQGLVFKITLKI